MADARSMKERMLAGEPYLAADPELQTDQQRAMRLMEEFNASSAADPGRRLALLTELFGSIGENSFLRPPIYVDYGYQVHVGKGVFANFGLVMLDVGRITIGDNVQIGPNCQLLTPTHPLDPQERLDHWEGQQPITIEENVWLGGGVIVLPGVTIGKNSVIGAGSVVTKDIPANVIAVGNPAKVVKEI